MLQMLVLAYGLFAAGPHVQVLVLFDGCESQWMERTLKRVHRKLPILEYFLKVIGGFFNDLL